MTIIKSIALALGLALLSMQANASDPYLVRQASELEALSYEIARELRYSGQHSALRREAEQRRLVPEAPDELDAHRQAPGIPEERHRHRGLAGDIAHRSEGAEPGRPF